MNYSDVATAMKDQPWGIRNDQGRQIYDFICREKPERILELGAGIGTSACFMAAALSRLGRGKITSIDRNPDLPDWLARTFAKVPAKVSQHHELIISETSYNDELLPIIEAQSRNGVCEPLYDFCFIDGAHTWEVDACAFFLAEKLLKPGKWVLFDDMTWTTPTSSVQQVTKIFTLCVAQHPRFTNLTIDGDWGWAQKAGEETQTSGEIFVRRPTLSERVVHKLRRMAGQAPTARSGDTKH